MKYHRILFLSFFILFQVQMILAGPGGKIARALTDTIWGKIIIGVLIVIFLPLILYVQIKEFLAKRKTLKIIDEMAKIKPEYFNYLKLKGRVKDAFVRIHVAWSKKDLEECSNLMDHWYWQNQQMIYLDRWENQGLENVCNIRKVLKMKPLHIDISQNENFNESRIVWSIEANMLDYLKDTATGKVVEGSTKYQEVETVWTFVLSEGVWLVEDIEEDTMSLAYAKLVKQIPDFEQLTTRHQSNEAKA